MKDLCLLVTGPTAHHSKGLCFGANRRRRVTDISTMTALFIGGHEGERPDGISSRWGGGGSILSSKAMLILYMIQTADIAEYKYFRLKYH